MRKCRPRKRGLFCWGPALCLHSVNKAGTTASRWSPPSPCRLILPQVFRRRPTKTDGQVTTPTRVHATWLLWRRKRNIRRKLTHIGMCGAAFYGLGDVLRYTFHQPPNDALRPVTCPAGLCNAVRRHMRTASGNRPLDKSTQCAETFTVRDRIQQGSQVICHHSWKSSSCACAHFQISHQPFVIQLQQSSQFGDPAHLLACWWLSVGILQGCQI